MTREQLNRVTFTAFMVEGCGEFLGGLLLVIFSHRVTNLPAVYSANGTMFLAAIVALYVGFEEDQEWLILLGAFVVGVADCFSFSLALSVAGNWRQPGLSLFNLGQSGTVAILSILHIILGLPYLGIIYTSIFLISTFVLFRHQQELKSIQPESM